MAAMDVPSSPDRTLAVRSWLAFAVAVLAIGAGAVGLTLGLTPSPADVIVRRDVVASVATFGLVLTFTLVGLILRRSRVENAIGWLLLAFGATVGLSSVLWGVIYTAGLPGGDATQGQAVAWMASVVTVPTWIFLAVSLVVRFPSGRPESTAGARLLRYAAAICVVTAVLAGLRPGTFLGFPSFSNPLVVPVPFARIVTLASGAAILFALVPLGLAVWGMLERYRRAATVERLQLRWFAYAGGLAITGSVLYVVIGVLLAPENEALRELTYVVLILGIASQPIAILQAITRHRLYDIDTIIGRTFAYGALTAILAGLYAASLRLFNALFVASTGQTSEASLVLTTLVLATTFTPIKGRLERWAAKRFPPAARPGQPMPEPSANGTDDPQLATQMEAIARRVAREVAQDVLAESRQRSEPSEPDGAR